MTNPQVTHDKLITRLRSAIADVVDLDEGSHADVEIVGTALVDMLGSVLARLPMAAFQEGAAEMGIAMGNRLVRKVAVEVLDRGKVINFAGTPAVAAHPAKGPPEGKAKFNGRAKSRLMQGGAGNA